MCMKIVYLDTELLKDAMRKVESVQHIRTFYRKSHEYQLGGIVYDLRKKFQRMTRLYKKSFDHMNDEDHNQHIRRWVEIHQLSLELDNLIKATVRYENSLDQQEQKKAAAYEKEHPTSPWPSSAKPIIPSNSDEDDLTDLEKKKKKPKGLLRVGAKQLRQKAPRWRPKSASAKNRINGYGGFDSDY
ncbi:uncharacterized protein LOC119629125 [Bombyx mori]|uniref:Uncharacterized protein n=1 Tax=Bombyx mori TaxID=7091 RepID=A0A8R2QV98_BOMMO|nr:uncharacterized protein LOC119629125 [Bombyx mori]